MAKLSLSRATFYRRGLAKSMTKPQVPRRSPRKLTPAEEQAILALCHEERFWDKAPTQLFYTCMEEGRYLASIATIYRILKKQGETKERRHHHVHHQTTMPRLCASRPNEIWTWDITKIALANRTWINLYVLLDLYSRYMVGWHLAKRECQQIAAAWIRDTVCHRCPGHAPQVIHSDRGAVMRSDTLADLYERLEIKASFSRPRVSNDNPYSESLFKTTKYDPQYPDVFQDGQEVFHFMTDFVRRYHQNPHHGLAYFSPEQVYFGRIAQVAQERMLVREQAFKKHPERFIGGLKPIRLPPPEVWINRPQLDDKSNPR